MKKAVLIAVVAATWPSILVAQTVEDDKLAVEALLRTYATGLTNGDAKLAASPFHAESVHRALNSGRTRVGRSEWEKAFAESFARRPKGFARQYSVTYSSVRLIRPDVAVADGMITTTGGPGGSTEEKAIVVATKEGGQWSIIASYSVVPASPESLPKQ